MPLWHFRSDTLKGFYASEVYAAARSKKQAVLAAGAAFDNWMKTYHDDMGFWPLIVDYFDEEGQAQIQIAEQRRLFLEEARAKFQNRGESSILTVS
jgi:hypothetical protein